MRPIVHGLAAFALLGAWGAVSQAGTIIYDTTPEWDGITSIAGFGSVQSGFTPTFGQTFLAPGSASLLLNFSFFLTDFTPGDVLTFQPAVYQWSGSPLGGNPPQGAFGSPIFVGSNVTFQDTGNFQQVTVDTGGVPLTPGATYVALLTTTDSGSFSQNSSATGLYQWGLTGFFIHQPNNGGGGFVFNSNTDNSQLNNGSWDTTDDFGDLAWTATLLTVPEPNSLIPLGLGLAGLLAFRRRHLKAAPARRAASEPLRGEG
jgi:PEP-CTERM motif